MRAGGRLPRPTPIVLIVAGDSGTRQVLVRAAELEGLIPLIGSSVEDAYGLLAEHLNLIVLIVFDVVPTIVTASAVRHLQLDASRIAAIPAIVVSDRQLTHDELATLPPTPIVTKPFDVAEARDIVRAGSRTRRRRESDRRADSGPHIVLH
jgi:DNA-binding NtrC family response regulator